MGARFSFMELPVGFPCSGGGRSPGLQEGLLGGILPAAQKPESLSLWVTLRTRRPLLDDVLVQESKRAFEDLQCWEELASRGSGDERKVQEGCQSWTPLVALRDRHHSC